MVKKFNDFLTYHSNRLSPLEQSRSRDLLKLLVENEYVFNDHRLPKMVEVGWNQLANILQALEEGGLIEYRNKHGEVSCKVTEEGRKLLNQENTDPAD
jgi:predicted transcriptional regulator